MVKATTKKAKAVDEDYDEEEMTETADDVPEDEDADAEEEADVEEESADEDVETEDADDFRARAKKNVKEKKGGKMATKTKPAKVAAKKTAKPVAVKKTGKVVKMDKPKKERTGPFRPTSTLNEAFEACKAGATEKELTAIAKKGNVTPSWLIGVMKKGKRVYPAHQWTWDVADRGGKLKISNLGTSSIKGKKKAA